MGEMLSFLRKPRLSELRHRVAAIAGGRGFAGQMFQLKTDPLTGKSEWVVIEVGDEDVNGNSTNTKSLLANTLYLDMLNDSYRNKAFRRAIENTVNGPCRVLDIGAGTGLLSMMAARAMGVPDSQEVMITACESYLPMFKLMRKVLRANHMDRRIHMINKRSDELEVGVDIPSRADVLVSEILDSEFLGEGLIPTLQHAYDKLLVENPRTVPYRATTYAQLIECKYLWEMNDLVNREQQASDGIHLAPRGMPLIGIKKQQYPLHCDALKEEIKLLSAPFKVFEFEFWRRPESFHETKLQIKAINDGTIHAIMSWWLLQLDAEGTTYSTEPEFISSHSDIEESSLHGYGQWRDHWKQTIWLAPGLPVVKDEQIELCASQSETSIAYEFKFPIGAVDHGLFTSECKVALSPEKNALYGDPSWRNSMHNATKKILCNIPDPLCLVADDSIFLAISILHLSKTSRLIPLLPGLGSKGLQCLQNLAPFNNFTMDRIEILNKGDLLSAQHLGKINLLAAEPYYFGNSNLLPWENLRFWKERTVLSDFLSEDAQFMPCRGLLKACAVYLPDLWKSRCCLNEIEQFDHSAANNILGACGGLSTSEDTPFLPYFVWQCGEMKILSETATILEFDFSKPMRSLCWRKAQVGFEKSGKCNGFILWMEWVMDAEGEIVLSTGPDKRHWKQGVKLLNEPVEVGERELKLELEASFEASNANLTLLHKFLKNY